MSPVLDGRERLLRELSAHVGDRRVLEALRSVPRPLFVPADLRQFAWCNQPLAIGQGQTISQPLVVAHMCELLRVAAGDRVLDVGTGSGYHAAVLSRLAGRVYSIERHRSLSEQAGENLRAAGISNVELFVGDGTLGFREEAPFDAINVAAAGRDGIPVDLEAQLADGGRLIIPIAGGVEGVETVERGVKGCQRLVLVERRGEEWRRTVLRGVRFVPLVAG